MDWIINVAGKVFGLKALWDKIDGYKTYIGGVAQMLTGAGMMLTGAAGELTAFVANVHDIAGTFHFIQALSQHPDAPVMAAAAGWGLVLVGWHVIAKKHADDKAAAAALAPVVTAPAAPPAVITPNV